MGKNGEKVLIGLGVVFILCLIVGIVILGLYLAKTGPFSDDSDSASATAPATAPLGFGTFVRDWADTLKHDSGQVRFRNIHSKNTASQYRARKGAREADRRKAEEQRAQYEASAQYEADQRAQDEFRAQQAAGLAQQQYGTTYQYKNRFSDMHVPGGGGRYEPSFGDAKSLMPQGQFPGVPNAGGAFGKTALEAHLDSFAATGRTMSFSDQSATSLKGLRPDPPVNMNSDWGILTSAQKENIQRGLDTQGVKSGFTMGTEWDFDALEKKNGITPYTQLSQR